MRSYLRTRIKSKNKHSYKIQSGLTVYWYLRERCAHVNAHPYVKINLFIELLMFVFYFVSWHLLINYISHYCRTFVSVCVKCNWSSPSKKEIEELCQALGLEKSGKDRLSRENRSNHVFTLTDFNINTWYRGLASDGFFLLSSGWRILCFTALKHSILKSILLSHKEVFWDLWWLLFPTVKFLFSCYPWQAPRQPVSCPFCFVAVWQQYLLPRLS